MIRTAYVIVGGVLTGMVVLTSCGGGLEEGGCTVGSEGCSCTAGGACDPYLSCLSGICAVTATWTSHECESSADFTATYDVTTDCVIGMPATRTSRILVTADGSEVVSGGEWQTTVETMSGAQVVGSVVSIGGCYWKEPARLHALRVLVTESDTSDMLRFVCGSSVWGTFDTTCDGVGECAEPPCVDGEEGAKDVCAVNLQRLD